MQDSTEYLISYQTDSVSTVTINPEGIGGTITRQIGEDVFLNLNVAGDELFTNNINLFDFLIDLFYFNVEPY